MRGFDCGHRRRGLTAIEFIAALIIASLVIAVAVPVYHNIQCKRNQAQLDARAEAIYNAAQDRLLYLRSSGDLGEVQHDLAVSDVDTVGQLTVQPQDWLSSRNAFSWDALYYLEGGQTCATATTALLSNSKLSYQEMTDGCYYIELDPQTGDVYGVFCSDTRFSYADITALANRSSAPAEAGMGYYGGEDIDSHELSSGLAPSVTIDNGNDLVATVSCAGYRNYMRSSDGSAVLNVKVSDESGNTCSANHTIVIDASTPDTITATVTLDSMQTGKSFSDIFSGGGDFTGGALNPGDDITVSCNVSYTSFFNGTLESYVTPVSSAKVNSLFASRDSGDIYISCARHLNNLHADRYTYTGKSTLRVVQTGDIDFAAKPQGSSSSAADILGSAGFEPIVNASLFGDDDTAGKASYDGGGYRISNITIRGGDATGLFGITRNVTICNVLLEDARVVGSSDTGSLVGRMHGGTLDGCGVRLSTTTTSGAHRDDMTTRSALYRVEASSNSSAVGGLVGSVDGKASLKNSYAACDVTASAGLVSRVGGLIGSLADGTVERSYASGSVTSANRDAGGLVGCEENATLRDCMATGDVAAVQAGGGLLGTGAGGKLNACTSYGHVTDPDGRESITEGGFCATGTSAAITSCAYLTQDGYNTTYTSMDPNGVSARNYQQLSDSVSGRIGKDATHAYSSSLADARFPFASVNDEYWGDWPGESVSTLGALAYYEVYGDGSSGYYANVALTTDGQVRRTDIIDTLKDATVVEDGYALIQPYALDSASYSLDEGAANAVNISHDASSAQDLVDVDDDLEVRTDSGASVGSLHVYRLPRVLQGVDTTNRTAFYDQLKFTTSTDRADNVVDTYYYDPCFAKTAINPTQGTVLSSVTTKPTETPTTIAVRSARQLNLLGRDTYWCSPHAGADNGQFVFTQEVDIDFANYRTSYCGKAYDLSDTSEDNAYRNVAIGTSGNDANVAFSNIYNGQMREIVDFRLATSTQQAAGLFGTISGATIKNVVLRASTSGSSYVRSSYTELKDNYHSTPVVGSLVGCIYTDGKSTAHVENCATAGMQVSWTPPTSDYEYNAAVGGLVGYNFGEVTSCSSVCDEVSVGSTDIGSAGNVSVMDAIGGIVGSNAGTISDSYAGGTLAYRAGASKAQVEMGGVSGHYFYYATTGKTNMVAKITDCYSYASGKASADFQGRGVANYYQVANDELRNSGNTNTESNNHYDLDGYDILGCSFQMFAYQDQALNYHSDDASPRSANELADLKLSDAFGKVDVSHSYTSFKDEGRPNIAFPYPAVVRAMDGAYVHYGNWPAS